MGIQWKALTKELLNQYPRAHTILLVGSYAEGKATKYSDIDLCLIGSFEDFQRVKSHYQQKELELMIAPMAWYYEAIESYERRGHQGTITRMLSHCKVLHNEEPQLHHLLETASTYWQVGPPNCSKKQLQTMEMKVQRTYTAFMQSKADDLTSQWLMFKYLDVCLDTVFKLNGWWSVKDREKLYVIQKKQPYVYRHIKACLHSEAIEEHAQLLHQHILVSIKNYGKNEEEKKESQDETTR